MKRALSLALFWAGLVAANENRGLQNDVSAFIVNGFPALPGDFPWAASLSNCAGVLIHPLWVLTAAHCQSNGATGTTTLGTIQRTPTGGAGYYTSTYTATNNPAYTSANNAYGPSYNNDIALLRLNTAAWVPPLRLQDPTNNVNTAQLTNAGTPVTTVGWGQTTQAGTGPMSPNLLYGDLTIQPDSWCSTYYGNYNSGTNVCESARPEGTCPGDSGGPSVAYDPVSQEVYGVALTSYGAYDCGNSQGNVFTRTSAFWTWIRSTTGLSFRYFDAPLKGGHITATDKTPTTGFTPMSANKPPKAPKAGKTPGHNGQNGQVGAADSWSVTSLVPEGSRLLSQIKAGGIAIALEGTKPAAFERVLDTVVFTSSQCADKGNKGTAVTCGDGSVTLTVTVQPRTDMAKVSIKAVRRDIKLDDRQGLEAYLWLPSSGDNWNVFNGACKRSGGNRASSVTIKC